ncbi:MAG: ATP-binding cassette domain-containing protein [Planctomycetota bacterium]|jgi:iron complex transport system ATP-binding protein|nr:ATP-binding cassette domain-containing protein [Planctomycetota bacterium]
MGGFQNYLEIAGLAFRRSGREILGDVSWTMPRGENWAVIGANGSGKTTLLQIAGGVLFPTSGSVAVLGRRFGKTDLFQIRMRVGWVSSALAARMPGHETLLQTVLTGSRATFGSFHEYSPEESGRALDLLGAAGLGYVADSPFGVLSQGEKQRGLFCRALMPHPELLILDEACAGLDLKAREEFLRNAGALMRERKVGVILVAHHIEEIPPETDQALVLKDGRVLASGPTDGTITGAVLSEAFDVKVRVERAGGRFWSRI